MIDTDIKFSAAVAAAYNRAWVGAAPFVPSMIQVEDVLRPLVNDLLAMPLNEAHDYIHESFEVRGAMPLVIKMFKESM